MSYLLFENPKYLLLFLGIIDFILIFFMKTIPFNKKKVFIIVIAVLIPFIHVLSKVVETDNEKIKKVLLTITRNANKEQIDSVATFLDKDFKGEFDGDLYDKDNFIELLKEKVGKKVINAINFKINKIKFNKNTADSTIVSFVDLTTSDGVFRLPLQWEIYWIKVNNKWYIVKTLSPTMIKL